jgi:hypothetical protein
MLPLSGGTLTGALTARTITPNADDTQNLGSAALRWATVYTADLRAGGGTLTGALTARTITPNEDNTRNLGSAALRWATVYTADLRAGGGTLTGALTSQSVTPAANNTYSLGVAGTRFSEAHFTTGFASSYFFQSDTDSGIAWTGTATGIYRDATLIASVPATGIMPGLDETYNLGTASLAWNNIYYQTATDVSDKELKTDIADGDLGLDFIDALRPVKFRWRNGGLKANGERDSDGNPIYIPSQGVRFHYGLVADEVKAALGEKDFGGYVEDAESGRKGLRYSQITSVLIKAVQELHGQVKEERQARLAMEQRLAALEMALGPVGASRAKA